MARLGIDEKDLEESFVLGSGRGGQKRQKTSNCVVLRHLPTKTVIKYSKSRSRELNRLLARRLLCEKLDPVPASQNKIRKQKKRRQRRGAVKFLCDETLGQLGEWLRAAGYDTDIAAAGTSGDHLIKQAKKEKRVFITCDHYCIEKDPESQFSIYLSSNDQKSAVRELTEKISIDWLYKPLTRCLKCNTPFIKAPEDALSNALEINLEPCSHCPRCKQQDPHGTHTDNLLQILRSFRSFRFIGDPANEREEKEPDGA